MSAGYSDVRRWDASTLGQAGDCILAGVRRLERAAEAMGEQTFPSGWEGRGATAAAITRNRLVHWLEIQTRIRTKFAKQVFAAEGQVAAIERAIEALDDWARGNEFLIADDGSITDEHDYGFPTPDDIVTYIRRRNTLEALVDRRDEIVRRAAEVDATLRAAAEQATDNEDPDDGIGLPSQEVKDEWAAMTDAEREEVLRNMAVELAERYGVPVYSITFGPLGSNTIGSHDPSTHEITINTAYLDDPVVLNTISHEMMHAGHDNDLEGFPGLSPSDIEELQDNEDNYRQSRNDWEDYRYQPEEDITRREADEFVDDLTPEQLDGYR